MGAYLSERLVVFQKRYRFETINSARRTIEQGLVDGVLIQPDAVTRQAADDIAKTTLVDATDFIFIGAAQHIREIECRTGQFINYRAYFQTDMNYLYWHGSLIASMPLRRKRPHTRSL
jgi:hypothetical protein